MAKKIEINARELAKIDVELKQHTSGARLIPWPKGEEWEKGDKWERGDKWDKGDKWEQWPRWFNGIDWNDGKDGKNWRNGIDGETGWKWPRWPKGEKGDKWDTMKFSDLTVYERQILTWPQGSNGVGVPRGGTTGQKLIKSSNRDFDTEWTADSGGGWEWWGITGTLADQTDLQTALNAKEPLKWADDNYVTDAEKLVIGNTSGTNTGDQDLSPYFNKSVDDTDDITVGATNKFATAAEKTKLGHITVTQAVDLDTIESDTATNNAKVTNATHTGDVTGSEALTIDKTAITGKTAVTAVWTDYVIISDTSDSGNLKKALVSDFAGSSGATTALDNLASVAINTSLISDTDETDSLGSAAIKWLNIFVKNIGATATRITKGWFTDIESTNIPTVNGGTLASALNLSGTNTWDQTSIVGITGTLAQFNTAITDANIIPEAGGTFTGDISVPDEAYGSGWNGSVEVPTKNAVYDKVETITTTTATSLLPVPLAPLDPGDAAVIANTIITAGNTTLRLYKIVVPVGITISTLKIVWHDEFGDQAKFSLYSDDGQTRYFSEAFTPSTTPWTVNTFTLSAWVPIKAWIYWFATNVVSSSGTANIQFWVWQLEDSTLPQAYFNISGSVYCWNLTITANTPPTTFSPADVTFSISPAAVAVRFN